MGKSVTGAMQLEYAPYLHEMCCVHLPVALLHKPPKNHVAVGVRPRNDIRLVVLAMAHDILGDLRCSCEQDLASDRKAVLILDTRKVPRAVSGAVEHNLCMFAQESGI